MKPAKEGHPDLLECRRILQYPQNPAFPGSPCNQTPDLPTPKAEAQLHCIVAVWEERWCPPCDGALQSQKLRPKQAGAFRIEFLWMLQTNHNAQPARQQARRRGRKNEAENDDGVDNGEGWGWAFGNT